MPIALTGLDPKMRDGRSQFWMAADQMIRRQGDGPDQGIILLGAVAHNDPDTSLIRNLYWVGLLDRGFWDARPTDQIGLGFTYYDVSPSLTRTEELQTALGALSGGAQGVQTHGMVVEVNYNIQPYPGVQVQPELEYFVRPGATGAVANAFLVGAKTYINF